MGILKTIGDVLFGKDPEIFDDKGNVVHKLPKRKWDDWANRYIKGDEYNWRTHVGTKAGAKNDQAPKNAKY